MIYSEPILERWLSESKRPVIILGWGVWLAGAEQQARQLCNSWSVPVVTTWGAAGIVDAPNFGTHGARHANYCVQNADLIISIGSRLDTKATGSEASSFAPNARIVMCDIDQTEILKFLRLGRRIDMGVVQDCKVFMRYLIGLPCVHRLEWARWFYDLERRLPVAARREGLGGIDPYSLCGCLSDLLARDDTIISDTGMSLVWMMQAFRFKGQRFLHAFNNTPMGYGLPAAVGAAFATGGRVVLITGDGGLSVNITELATVAKHNLPIKILLFNNRGHGMCRQTQRQWLGGEYRATGDMDLATPDFAAVAAAYGLTASRLERSEDAIEIIRTAFATPGPTFVDITIDPEQDVRPQVKVGYSIECGEPLLSKEEDAAIRASVPD